MDQQVSVRFLPSLIEPDELQDATAVIIDVLRATSTICAALASGAKAVIPCLEITDAQQLRASGQADVCGGERACVSIEGFDFGNSPLDYGAAAVHGKTVAFTTTNGTRAMKSCQSARQVFIASFLNLDSLVDRVSHEEKLVIVCAGTAGSVTSEDVLLAGAIVSRLLDRSHKIYLNDEAQIALQHWNFESDRPLLDRLRQSLGGRNLLKVAFDKDIAYCAQVNLLEIVPELKLDEWKCLI